MKIFFGGGTFNGHTIMKKSCKYFDLQDSVAKRENFYITLSPSETYWYSRAFFKHFRLFCTLFPTPLLKSLRRLWHYDTRFLLFNKSIAIIFCLSSHYLCIMFMNCPYERGIILHHDHYLTIIIQMPISQIWLWKLYLHIALLIFKMLQNFIGIERCSLLVAPCSTM